MSPVRLDSIVATDREDVRTLSTAHGPLQISALCVSHGIQPCRRRLDVAPACIRLQLLKGTPMAKKIWDLKYVVGNPKMHSRVTANADNPMSRSEALAAAATISENGGGWRVWVEHATTSERIFESDAEKAVVQGSSAAPAAQNARSKAESLATQNLAQCAAEVLAWRKTGILADDAHVRRVAAAWAEAGDSSPEQQAENTVVLLALRQVAGHAQAA